MKETTAYTPPEFSTVLKNKRVFYEKTRNDILWKEIKRFQEEVTHKRNTFLWFVNMITKDVVTAFQINSQTQFEIGEEYGRPVCEKLRASGWPVVVTDPAFGICWLTIKLDE